MDNKNSNNQECHAVIIVQEILRYNIDIVALSEMGFADTGALTEASASYTFFCSGKGKNETREARSSFTIQTMLARHLEARPI